MSKKPSYLGWKIDFTEPAGEEAYSAPDSISWQIFKNPVALGIGGVAAVLLEFAEPRIRSGVWDHSTFKEDPFGRASRTGVAAMISVYGPQSVANRVIQGVTNMHMRVEGETPDGTAYKAMDPDLLDWVHATAVFGFTTAYDRFVRPLSQAEKDQSFADGAPVSALYGVEQPCHSYADFYELMDRLSVNFEPHEIVGEFLDIISSGKFINGVPRFLQNALANAAVSILPDSVRDVLELGPQYDLSARDEAMFRFFGRLVDRVPVPVGPPADSCARLGLPRTYLWRSPATRQKILQKKLAVAPAPAE